MSKITKKSLEELADAVQCELFDIFTNETFNELDTLSSHTRVADVSDVELKDVSRDEDVIEFSGTATVSCDLQYGSDRDCERGRGDEATQSFPIKKFSGTSSVTKPYKITILKNNIEIDTTSFYK